MALTTLVAGNTITASGLNDNFSFCVLTDTAKTISVTHTYSASQTFSAGWTSAAACTITAASATALTVGRQGATDPALLVHSSTASQATGIQITGKAATSGAAIVVISSGTNENLTVDAKGSGTITIGATSTGNVVLGDSLTVTSAGAVSGVTTLAIGGAFSGATTGAFSGVITSTFATGADAVLKNSSSGTNTCYIDFTNTGGRMIAGVDSSAGGSLATGSTAYATVLAAVGSRAVEFSTATTVRMGIVGVAGTPANSSVGNIYIPSGTAPTGNPTGMLFVWAEAGAGKARGTGGTVTTWAPAEPHCPVCGSDFGLEWENERYGGTLRVCMKCLTDELGDRPWIQRIH